MLREVSRCNAALLSTRNVEKLYEGNASGKIPDKHFERMLAEYDAEQNALESKIPEMEAAIECYNADSVRVDKFM